MLNNEPVLTATVLMPVVVWLLARFGLAVDVETATGIAASVLAVGAYVARLHVTPVDRAAQKIEQAYVAEPGRDPKPVV